MIRVATTNFYYNNRQPQRDARHVANVWHPDVWGIQEGNGGNCEDIRTAVHDQYHVWWSTPKDKDRLLAAKDTPVAYRRSNKIKPIRHWNRLISKRSQAKDIGMPRSATVLRFHYNHSTVSFINTHCNAAVQGPRGNHLSTSIRRVYEYIKGMIVLEQMVKNARKRGDRVILVGDMNYHDTRTGIWRYSPQALAKRCKLHQRSVGLDHVMYDHSFKMARWQVQPAHHNMGADHPWLFADLVDV
jgi:exonuclease III